MDYNTEELRKIGKTLEKKAGIISDEDMKNVVGGFMETNKNLYTHGLNIICPTCRASDAECFEDSAQVDTKQQLVRYTCKNCGPFVVVKGYAITQDAWNDWMAGKKIKK
ncbi:MAG: hypothetical protein K6F86_08725 [Lachnospiraceae bacterium]|nr:hypothetical protein [Lachnospiraceae bacterium]